MKKVLITGIFGQDGAFLAKELIYKGFKVFGLARRGGSLKSDRLRYLGILNDVEIKNAEITDFSSILKILEEIQPDAIFNLAAQSFVQDSFINPSMTSNINYFGVLNLYEALRFLNFDCKVYQASTSEMYGKTVDDVQTEKSPFDPQSPYGISKLAAHHLGVIYRDTYKLKISNGILFNHESELRGREFVTRKITSQLVEVRNKARDFILLGNLNAVRDWGYAPDYVKAIEIMNFSEVNDDFVVATNKITSVREFFRKSAEFLDFKPIFSGNNAEEICTDATTNKVIMKIDKNYYRPLEVDYLRGDYSKINSVLGWKPETSIDEMIETMISFDLENYNKSIYFI